MINENAPRFHPATMLSRIKGCFQSTMESSGRLRHSHAWERASADGASGTRAVTWAMPMGMKDREAILRSRWLKPFGHLFAHPSLWHLNRRSVPRALALGLFAAFIVPVGQFALAAFLAVPLRANVPLAAAATLVSNPLTFPPIYFAAYKIGTFLLDHSPGDEADELAKSLGRTLLDVSGPTALGLVVLAILGAAAGYIAGTAWWRLRLVRRWGDRRAESSRVA